MNKSKIFYSKFPHNQLSMKCLTEINKNPALEKKGGYGEIIGAKFKDTGEEIVLKKNLYYKKSRLMFMDIIHEVIKITRYYI